MRVEFLGGARTVTGSATLLENGSLKWLVAWGFFPGDSAHMQEMEAEWGNRKGKRAGRNGAPPLYTKGDAEKSLQCFQPVGYDESFTLADGLRIRFRDAGPILGSAIV